MILDIEKIKAQFSSWFDKKTTVDEMVFADDYPWEQEDTGNQMNLAAQAYYAGYKAALEAYDPDAIRRENIRLAEKLRQYLPHCGKQDMTNGDRELVEWVDAIMNAEKE